MTNGHDPKDGLSAPIFQGELFVICPICGGVAGSGLRLLDDFFYGNSLTCDACKASTDAWRAYLATLNHPVPFMHDVAAIIVGYKSVFFKFELSSGETIELNLTQHGIPAGSRLIRLNFTPAGTGLFPVELHGNEALFRRGGDRIILYGRPFPQNHEHGLDTPNPHRITIQVMATFAEPHGLTEQAEGALSRAFVALSQHELIDMVIPATMAVEFTCKRLINDVRSIVGSSAKRVKDRDLLNKAVPAISTAIGVPRLNTEICSRVVRLWGQRDAVAHTGQLHQPYPRETAAEQLAAAVFAFRYLMLLRAVGTSKGLI